jgi:preprotein translocase subunit SecF
VRTPRFDFVGRSRTWLIVSSVAMLISIGALMIEGLNLSIDFTGGTSFAVEGITRETAVSRLQDAAQDAGATDVRAQLLGSGEDQGAILRMAAIELNGPVSQRITAALQELTGAETINESFVGPTWGSQISRKAIEALIVFMIVVVAYISIRLEFKMAVAAVIALVHDITITLGVYSILDFTVSPNTVIALLTILGYSLYDTVVVFDRVEENTEFLGQPGRRTYAQVINTSQNEVLWRSINTTLTSILPVGGLLFIGARLLGATTLEDLALALFVGMSLGAYSSLFVAGPFLAWWRSQEPEMVKLIERAAAHGEETVLPTPEAAVLHRRPITTEYVRGEGKNRRKRKR